LAEHVAGVTLTPHNRLPDVDWIRKKELSYRKAVPADPDEPDCIPMMSCGYPKPTVAVRIVNKAGEEIHDREVGEVLLKSPSLFSGYHMSPEETDRALKEGWLYTGDLGYVVDGQLYIVGRKKDLIIVGGNNIAPDYIESIARSVLGKTCRYSAAFGIYDADLGSEIPVLVCEMQQVPDDAIQFRVKQQIREQMKDALDVFIADIYMVEPGWIIKTTSGKISRSDSREKYLSETNQDKKAFSFALTEGAEPIDVKTIQQRLVKIWEKLFRLPSISIDNNFFELGGDSLLAIQLMQEIENTFHISLPVTLLFESATISGLTRHIIQYRQSPNDDTLVSFHTEPTSSDCPIFFGVHGIGGGVLEYRQLANALGPEQPFYGIAAKNSGKTDSADTSIESIAASYIESIKCVQPTGPFCLGGICFGGVVAFEMARQLLAAGDEIQLLAIFEGYPPSFNPDRSKLMNEWLFAFNFLRNLPFWIRDYYQLGRLDRRHKNHRLSRVFRKRFMRLMGFNIELDKHDVVDDVASLAERYQNVLENNIQAMRRYQIKPFDGHMVLFRTPHRVPGRIEKPDRGWRKLSADIDIQMIPGAHTTMLSEPNVGILADKLKRYL
jgi:thioesterase domain-containing protein/acyl carrier protein